MSKGNTPRTNKEGHEAEFAARRRIIKGLVSVPAVATLSNASAQAVASNLQCIGKEDPAVNLNTPTGSEKYDCQPVGSPVVQYPGHPDLYYDMNTTPSATRQIKSGGDGDGQACVVFVDSSGTTGTDPFDGTAGLNAVTPSCYTSFV